MTKRVSSVSNDKCDIKEFREDPDSAIGYLNAALEIAFEENEPELLLIALAKVAKARRLYRVAKDAEAQLSRLHRSTSKYGRPGWGKMFRVFRALDLRPQLESVENEK